jgi:hypothetical protein
MSATTVAITAGLVATIGCGRLEFADVYADCELQILDDSFAAEISGWNAAANDDELTTIVAHDASCAPDLAWIDAHLTTSPPRGTVTEVDLDWNEALDSYFFSSDASSEGPTLAVRIDSFLGAGETATARQRVERVSSEDREVRLIVFSTLSGLAVVLEGRKHDDD